MEDMCFFEYILNPYFIVNVLWMITIIRVAIIVTRKDKIK